MTKVAAPSAGTLSSRAAPPVLTGSMIFAMAAACAVAVANIYYNQPMLGVIERAFPGSAATGLIPTATQLGYALGLLLLVPIGDVLDRRTLIAAQFGLLALALATAAAAPSPILLVGASLLVGCTASVAQQIIPFAASLATPERRGGVIGTIMGGLLCGILLSRTLAGFVAQNLGWRAMFAIAVPMAMIAAGVMAAVLPRNQPRSGLGYRQALASLGGLWLGQPVLRRSTAMQAALFGSFSAFWTILALHLERPPFSAGADVAGLFGVIGAAGVIAAPIAGHLADRRGPRLTIAICAALALASWAAFGLWASIPGLVLGVTLLDLGVQGALVSNQHIVYALEPAARSRLNTLFMTGMFLGGSLGSAGATIAWRHGGWPAVTAFGAGLALLAFLPLRPLSET